MIPVKPALAARAHIGSMEEYRRFYRRSIEDPAGYWREQAAILTAARRFAWSRLVAGGLLLAPQREL